MTQPPPAALPFVHETVVHMLADAAERAPDAPALAAGDLRLTYREYLRCVAAFARDLRERGAGPGERVATVLGNSPDIAIATFGIHAAAAQAVPLNPLYTERELEQIIADAAPLAVIYDAATRDRVEPIIARLGIRHGIMVGVGGRVLAGSRDASSALPLPLPAADMPATLQYTGGTTGLPKGVNIRHREIAINISQREALLPTRKDEERILCVMPLFHIYAVAMALHLSCYCRGCLVILPKYTPPSVLAALRDERITLFPGSPTLYVGLMKYDGFADYDLSALRLCYSGAERLPEETLKRWEKATGCIVLEGYGQSESGPVVSFNPEHGQRKPASVGIPVPLAEVQIVDTADHGRVMPPGEPGEIRLRGPQIMSGYHNRPEETARALVDGWLYTGDLGLFDADGYLFIIGRSKEMAIVGGYNVYPREIEEVLASHPEILEVAVIGVPDPDKGEAIHAYVTLRRGARPTVEALREHCAARLVKYKLPAAFHIVDALPRTSVGKIDKLSLRER